MLGFFLLDLRWVKLGRVIFKMVGKQFRWIENSVTEIGKAPLLPSIFNHLN